MNKEQLRITFANNNEFIIKIRNEDKYIDKVYYNGIKSFEIDEKGNKDVAKNILQFNRASILNIRNEMGEKIDNDKITKQIIKIIFVSRNRLKKFKINNKSYIKLVVAPLSFKNGNKVLDKIKKELKKYGLDKLSFVSQFSLINDKYTKECENWNKKLEEMEKEKFEKKIIDNYKKKKFEEKLYFNDEDVELIKNLDISKIKEQFSDIEIDINSSKEYFVATLIEFIFVEKCIFEENYTYSNKTGFGIPEFKFDNEKVATFDDGEEFLKAIKGTIDIYIDNTSTKDETSEKYYQHQFMTKPIDFYKDLFPFEEEYYTKEGRGDDSKPEDEKGRIDCIFLHINEGDKKIIVDEIYLTELKINASVIGEPNGVEKHLKDIKEMLEDDKKIIKKNNEENEKKETFVDKLKKRIEYSLPYYKKFKDKEIEVIEKPKLYFNTIIAYEDGHKDECIDKLNEIRDNVLSYLTTKDECERNIYMHEYKKDEEMKFEPITDDYKKGNLKK